MNRKITISWVGTISPQKSGGRVYEDQVRNVLAKNAELDFVDSKSRYFKNRYLRTLESFFHFLKVKGKRDLWIRDIFSAAVPFSSNIKGKNLVIIHQLDFSGFPLISKPLLNLLQRTFFYPNLNKVDAIVTVSKYWENYLIKRGHKNIYTIHNSFNLSDFNISEKEVIDFKKKYNLQGKPIVYLGNCQKAKGVKEAFLALKDLDIHLVTSGEEKVNIPAMNLSLEYADYLKLLKASSIVIAMSKFKEGWCRTAHEAMLLRSPVIGSGLGGMKELLEGGKQVVCKDFKNLREKTEYLLNHPELKEKMGEDGYSFTKEFTLEKFEKKWIDLVNKII
ncbi:glycosyltransferase family 4 protein [Patescibacteria group bacterium]